LTSEQRAIVESDQLALKRVFDYLHAIEPLKYSDWEAYDRFVKQPLKAIMDGSEPLARESANGKQAVAP
jgi:hypothetical protein